MGVPATFTKTSGIRGEVRYSLDPFLGVLPELVQFRRGGLIGEDVAQEKARARVQKGAGSSLLILAEDHRMLNGIQLAGTPALQNIDNELKGVKK